MAEGGGNQSTDVGDLLSQFRCLGTTDRDVLINELHTILGGQITREQCLFVLEMSSWNLQNAIGAYYDYLSVSSSQLEMKIVGAYIDPSGPVTTGKQFYNTWMVINSGLEPWPSGVRLVYQTGYRFEGILEGPIDVLKPQERQNITVALKAPSVSGVYKTQWRLADPSGCFFGEILLLVIRVVEMGGVADLTDQLSAMSTGATLEPINELTDHTTLTTVDQYTSPVDQCTSSMDLFTSPVALPVDQHTSPLKSPVDQWSLQDSSPVDQYTLPIGGLWTDRTNGLEDDR